MKISISKEFLKDIIDQISTMAEYIDAKPQILGELWDLYDGANEPVVEADAQKACLQCVGQKEKVGRRFCGICGRDLRTA